MIRHAESDFIKKFPPRETYYHIQSNIHKQMALTTISKVKTKILKTKIKKKRGGGGGGGGFRK
jgi:biotin synthase-related radical SAM superfamily protein